MVPVKRFAVAKRRLTPALGASERAHLARVMLEDVLDALSRASAHLAGVAVVTVDKDAARLAERHNAIVISDEGCDDINLAIRFGIARIVKHGAGAVLVIPSDIPQLSPEAVLGAVDAVAVSHSLAVIQARQDRGTNLLACRPATMVPLCFGPDSFEKHCRVARAQGMKVCVLPAGNLNLDIDRPEDLASFVSLRPVTRTFSYLATLQASRPEHRGSALLHNFPDSRNLTPEEAFELAGLTDLEPLLSAARRRRDGAHGPIVSYSRKVFIPLTKLCRDVCHYCTFAHPPRAGEPAFMSPDEVLGVARAGRDADCKEALFTLGDKPELRYRAAREELAHLGHPTTLSYLVAMARLVFEKTGLFPHVNPGLLEASDLAALRKVSLSQGIMLESASNRLMQKGAPHYGSPDKAPAARVASIRMAGEQHVPFTTGILIGIGETRRERIEALFALRELHETYGHIQEIIIQNFRPKPGTRMANALPPSVDEHLWTIAVARLIFPPAMNIQAPPNLSPGALCRLIEAGINDWGGVSPVTVDHVNPEAPWPHLQMLERATSTAGKRLHERLPIYPAYATDYRQWVDEKLHSAVLQRINAAGWPQIGTGSPGAAQPRPAEDDSLPTMASIANDLSNIIDRAGARPDAVRTRNRPLASDPERVRTGSKWGPRA